MGRLKGTSGARPSRVYPPVRAALPPAEGHLSRSLGLTIRQGRFEVREDTAFTQVVRASARAAQG